MKAITKNTLLSGLATMAIFMSVNATAQAVPQNPETTEDCPDCVQENAPDRSRPVTDQSVYDQDVSKVKDALRSSELKSSTGINQFDFDKATVLEIEKDGERFHSVTVPVKGYSPLSNFTVVYEQDGSVSNYAESQFRKGDDGNFVVDQWMNGEFERTKNLGVEYIPDSKFEAEIVKAREQSEQIAQKAGEERGIGKVAACLTGVAGIGGPVAYVIAGACAGSCAAPELISKGVCAACIGAYAALGAGGMGAAAACFQLW